MIKAAWLWLLEKWKVNVLPKSRTSPLFDTWPIINICGKYQENVFLVFQLILFKAKQKNAGSYDSLAEVVNDGHGHACRYLHITSK